MVNCCTYFDIRYIARGISLHRSLARWGTPFHLWVLCLGEECHSAMERLALPSVTLLREDGIDAAFPALAAAKNNRSRFEYYATVKPFLLRWIFDHHTEVDPLLFLDADFWFTADPALLAAETERAAVLLSPHRLTPPPAGSKALDHGTFNAGFVSFRRDGGLDPLHWWCDRVAEWCRDERRGELFADQGYLDQMHRLFPDVVSSSNPGINVAPWNLDERDPEAALFFHAHGVRPLGWRLWDTGTTPYRLSPSARAIRHLYRPYIRELRAIRHWLSSTYGIRVPAGSVRTAAPSPFCNVSAAVGRIRRRQWLFC